MRRDEIGLGAAATLALGLPFLLIEVAQRSFSTPATAAARVGLAALTLAVLTAAGPRDARADLRRLLTTRLGPAALVALTAAALPNLLIGAAERHVPTGATAVLLALTPVWVAVGAALLDRRERVTARRWAALAAAVVGVATACGGAVPAGAWGWFALPLAASACYAVAALVVRHRLAGFHPLAVTTVEMAVAVVPLGLLAAWAPVPALVAGPPTPAAVGAVALAGIGCSGLGWLANTALIQRVGAPRASVVSYTSVVVSVALGAAVLREPVTARTVVGTVVLVVAVWSFLSPPRTKERTMLELSVLGFLDEEPLHAYELRRRISALHGHARPVSDGALAPALRRMERRGLLDADVQPGAGGPPRKVYRLTDAGREELVRRLAGPDELEITDGSRFFTLLAFLDRLRDAHRQRAVLERRLAFLEAPGRGFFVGGPERRSDRFRDGMAVVARDASRAERRWLRETILELRSVRPA